MCRFGPSSDRVPRRTAPKIGRPCLPAAGKLSGTSMPATMTLDVPALGLSVKFDGAITVE